VQLDNYGSILHFCLFLSERDLTSKCSFKVTLRPEATDRGSCACDIPVLMQVQSANLLHYALCIGSFQAAAALLIACPTLLDQSCSVTATYSDSVAGSALVPAHASFPAPAPASQVPPAAPETWSMVQVLGVFCRLCQHPETSALSAAGHRYRTCLNFLLIRQLNLVPDMVRSFAVLCTHSTCCSKYEPLALENPDQTPPLP